MATGNQSDNKANRPPIRAYAAKILFWAILSSLAAGFAALILFSYRDFVDPKHVYGSWIEIGTPEYQTEVLTLNEQGVFRNGRMVSTRFKFDGKRIEIKTGRGVSIYQLAGTTSSPQLKRLDPSLPIQRFVKEGYEDTINTTQGGGQARRAALSDHFSEE